MHDLKDIFLCLLISLVVLHIGMWIRGSSPRLWKAVDYVWLTIAAVSLVGLVAKAQRQELETDIYFAQLNVDTQAHELRLHTESSRTYASELLRMFEQSTDSIDEFKKSMCEKVLRYFDEVTNRIDHVAEGEASFKDIPKPGVLLFMPDSSPSLSLMLLKSASLQDGLESRVEYLTDFKSDANGKSLTEYNVIRISPWLLAIALAIRTTKVTASLAGYT